MLAVINNGTFILQSGCASVFELDAIAGTSDQVTFNSSGGNITLAGELNVENLGGLEPGDYKLFDLNGGTISGNFNSTNMPKSFLGEVSVSGGDVILTVTLEPQGTVILIN